MEKRTKRGTLRGPLGSLSRGYRIYIPQTFDNEDFILPSRNLSILTGSLRYRRNVWKTNGKEIVRKRLQTDFGLASGISRVFLSRSISQIKRIEQVVHGIMDSLLFFDPKIFRRESEDLGKIKMIVRKSIVNSVFNIGETIKMWKDFVNYIFIKLTETVTLEEPRIHSKNIFKGLLNLVKIKDLRDRELNKKDLQDLSHLISTRQLPSGDRRAEILALKKFESTVTSNFVTSDRHLHDLYEGAKKIGARCREAGPGPLRSAHISMAAAGSFYYSVKEGGRSEEILAGIFPILTFTPKEDEVIEISCFTLRCKANTPRWRNWFRAEYFNEELDKNFGDESRETLIGFSVFKLGFDEAIGPQILACALLEMESQVGYNEHEVLVRALSIPEPGFKVRIVTTGPWWSYVVMQSHAHVSRAFLSSHPSAEAGMGMSDQAWQYLYLIKRAQKFFKEDFWALSSDLAEATDAIPKEVALRLLEGFKDGLGYTSPLFDSAIQLLCSPRLCIIEKTDTVFSITRGILMGEPLAKTTLTLLNLVCEEIAVRKYLSKRWDEAVQVPWRCFSVAGDDHIAIGPKDYLEQITLAHLRSGSKISLPKHGMSRIAVKYCEKILDVRNIHNLSWTPKTINDSTEIYEKSPFVDSIKVRLLSPCSKSNENFNDRNTAVGKAKSLGRTLRWLNPSYYSKKMARMIRERFFQRMGPLLPPSSSGVFWHLLLPENLGGLGLWMEYDLEDLPSKLPDPTKCMIKKYLDGSITNEEKTYLKGFTSNVSYRGYELLESEVSLVKEFLIKEILYSGLTETITWSEARTRLDPKGNLSDKQVATRARSKMWLRADEVEDRLLRPFLFKEILSREAKETAFNTESFKRRYSRFWDISFTGHQSISSDELRTAFEAKPQEPFFDLSLKLEIYARGQVREGTLIEEMTIGLPDLSIPWEDIGELQKPETGFESDVYPLGEYV